MSLSRMATAAVGAAVATALTLLLTRRRDEVADHIRKHMGMHACRNDTPCELRLAEEGDCETILRLVKDLAVYEKEPAAVKVTAATYRRDGFGPRPLFRCIIARCDEIDVGFALFYNSYSTWQGRCLYLEDLYVAEAARGRGVGKLLLATGAMIARSTSCARYHWQALDWNTPALQFYSKIGARRCDEWVNLRMDRPEISTLADVIK